MRLIKNLTLIMLSIGFLAACTEAQYASHVIKQIPMPGDQPRNVDGKSAGYYKTGQPYRIAGRKYYPKERFSFSQTGTASWYGPNFHGKMTANGETFNKYELTAAHRTLQMPSIIRVTNLSNGRSLVLRVNDRGPFAHDRVLDVSERAAELLGFKSQGTAKVRIDVLTDPSRKVASMAQQRIDTTGYEIALNQNKTYVDQGTNYARNDNDFSARRIATIEPAAIQTNAHYAAVPPAKPQYEPITTMEIAAPIKKPVLRSVASDMPQDSIRLAELSVPESVASPPISAPPNFYVQAGAFREERNALSFSSALSDLGNAKVYLTRSNDTPTFRVKLGPYASNEEAASVLANLQSKGKNGIVIAE